MGLKLTDVFYVKFVGGTETDLAKKFREITKNDVGGYGTVVKAFCELYVAGGPVRQLVLERARGSKGMDQGNEDRKIA